MGRKQICPALLCNRIGGNLAECVRPNNIIPFSRLSTTKVYELHAHYGGTEGSPTSFFLESLSDSAAFLTTQKLRRGRGLVPAEVEDKGEEYLA